MKCLNNSGTGIMATLGPALNSVEQITCAISNGVNCFRLHLGSRDRDNVEYFKNIRKAQRMFNFKQIDVCLDFPADRPRTKNISPVELEIGQSIIFFDSFKGNAHNKYTSVPLTNLSKYIVFLNRGERIFFRGGNIVVEIMKVDEGNTSLVTRCIKNIKKLNGECAATFPDSKISFEPVGDEDLHILTMMKKANLVPDGAALSFSSNSEQLNEFKRILNLIWPDAPIGIIAKIENKQAFENLDDIVSVSDGLFVARSDLSLHLSPKVLPGVQRTILQKAHQNNKYCIIGSHFLRTFSKYNIINRAELNDVALGVRQKANALMLSGESGNSNFPIETIALMKKIIDEESNK